MRGGGDRGVGGGDPMGAWDDPVGGEGVQSADGAEYREQYTEQYGYPEGGYAGGPGSAGAGEARGGVIEDEDEGMDGGCAVRALRPRPCPH